MIETNVVDVNWHRLDFVRPVTGPLRALRQLLGGAIFATGLMSVAGLAAVLLVPSVRESVAYSMADIQGLSHFRTADPDTAASPGDSASQPLQVGQAVELDPARARVAVYLARRYHVADDAVRVIVAAAVQAGRERQIDPLLVLSVVAVESSMNPFAQSSVGATGLMQVMPELHRSKFADLARGGDALDPVANIRVGTRILGEYIQQGGSVERGLQLYVGAGNLPEDGGYASHVLSELGRLRLAERGDVNGALAAAQRADQHTAAPAIPPSAGPSSRT